LNNGIFETFDVDLASYLLMEDIELLGFELADPVKGKVIIRFKDPNGKCLDLERIFVNSDYKKYRNLNKYLLRQIHGTKSKMRG